MKALLKGRAAAAEPGHPSTSSDCGGSAGLDSPVVGAHSGRSWRILRRFDSVLQQRSGADIQRRHAGDMCI
jgi:hypothetical protein